MFITAKNADIGIYANRLNSDADQIPALSLAIGNILILCWNIVYMHMEIVLTGMVVNHK